MDILTLCIIVFIVVVSLVFLKDKLLAYILHHPKILVLALVLLGAFLTLKFKGII